LTTVSVHDCQISHQINDSSLDVATTSRYTSVPVRASTLHALQAYRVGGKSYDEIILDFIEANPPASFWKEIEWRSREPDLIIDDVRRKLGL